MKRKVDKLQPQAKMFSALAHPIRLALLEHLLESPRIVSDLVSLLDEDQTKVSKHLGILRQVGLVECEVDGRCRLYSLSNPETVQRLLQCLPEVVLHVVRR